MPSLPSSPEENFHDCCAIRPPTSGRLHALRQVRRGVQAHPLGHRPRRDSRAGISISPSGSCPTGCRRSIAWTFSPRTTERLLSQIQGRTYANIFGLVERFIAAKVLDVSRDHWLGDQNGAGGAGALRGRGDQAPGAVPPHRAHVRRGHARRLHVRAGAECRRVGRALEVHLGGAGADLPHRALRAGALSREHRGGRPTCPSSGRTCSSTTGKRNRSTRSSTSWSGCARTRSSRRKRAMRRWTT